MLRCPAWCRLQDFLINILLTLLGYIPGGPTGWRSMLRNSSIVLHVRAQQAAVPLHAAVLGQRCAVLSCLVSGVVFVWQGVYVVDRLCIDDMS